jgi:hypothetical protein
MENTSSNGTRFIYWGYWVCSAMFVKKNALNSGGQFQYQQNRTTVT